MNAWQKVINSRHSLSAKLVLLFVIMAILFVVLVGSGFRFFINHHFKDNVQPHIVKYLEYVQADLGSPLDTQRAQQLADELNLEIHIINDQQQWSSHGREINLSNIKIKHSHTVKDQLYSLIEYNSREYLMTQVENSTLLFTIPRLRPERGTFRGWLPFVILLMILLVLYYGTRRLFSPINTIQAGVKRFGEGELNHRIQTNRRDELGELAKNFNSMANDIQQMLEAKRQLLLAISHELRSPLTRAKVASEFLDDEQQKGRINRELDEMETLIEELLETERLTTYHTVLNKTPLNLAALITEV
ncbi:HAMP domain-containing protein, partial [Kaarinaea lacus]